MQILFSITLSDPAWNSVGYYSEWNNMFYFNFYYSSIIFTVRQWVLYVLDFEGSGAFWLELEVGMRVGSSIDID